MAIINMFITINQFHIYVLSLLYVINIWSHFSAHLMTNIYFSLVLLFCFGLHQLLRKTSAHYDATF